MDIKKVKNRFLDDVKEHQMTIIRNNGIDRHIRFRKQNTICYGFELITWDGHLCVTGDCGTYVFSRVKDMFSFFSNDKKELFINPHYWGEKLLSVDKTCGYKEYSQECFESSIRSYFDAWEFENENQQNEVWWDIKINVLPHGCDGETRAYDAANEYKSEYGHEFSDFWECDLQDYTYHFIWCLYAIVWGIEKYDQSIKKRSRSLD